MTKRIFVINIIFAITDTLIAALAIIAFATASFYFSRWWILIFTIVPLILFNSHSLLLSRDVYDEEGEDTYSEEE